MKTIKLVRMQSKEEQRKPTSTLDSFINLKSKHINWDKSHLVQPHPHSYLRKQTTDGLKIKGISQSQRIIFQRNASLHMTQNLQKHQERSILELSQSNNPELSLHNQSSSFLSSKAAKRLKTLSLLKDLKMERQNSIKNSFISNNSFNQYSLNKSRQFNIRKGKGYKLLQLIGTSCMNKTVKKSSNLNLSDITKIKR